MINSLINFINKRNLIWLVVVVFIIPTFYSLLRPGYYTMHDDLQVFRVHQMDKCFQDLQIPCRWVPDMGYQYGYPQYNFYPPSIFYLAEIFHLIGFQFIDTIKIIVVLGFILSAVFMYFFLNEWFGKKWPAFVGAVIYSYAPYKAVDSYVRGALNEFWALVFFPLIFWSALKLIKRGSLKNIAFFSVSVALLLLTHNLMALIFLPVVAIWVLTYILLERKWVALPKFFLGGLLAIGLAAFFTLPVVFESKFVHVDSVLSGYFDYRLHFANLNQLFISNFFDYGSSQWGPKDDMSLSTGQIHWIAGSFAVFLALLKFRKQRKVAVLTLIIGFFALLSLFLAHQKSAFVWEQIGILKWLQFPWRFLANSIFLLSILTAVGVYLLDNFLPKKYLKVYGVGLIILSLFLYAGFFKPHTWLSISDKDKLTGQSWEKQLTVSIFDYLPIYAKLPPPSKAPDLPEVMKGQVKFLSYKKGSNYQIGKVEVLTEKANLRLPLFHFPGMKVFIDGREIAHSYNDCRNQKYCLGLISIDVKKGSHEIEARLTDTPIRSYGNFLTLISLIIVGLMSFNFPKYVKNIAK